METASPLLQLPEELWTCVIFTSLSDIRDRVSACLACRRFYDCWGSSVFKEVQGRHVALTAGRFVQRRDGPTATPQLRFELECRGPRYEWMQLLARFLACCVPAGHKFTSFLHPRPCRSPPEPCGSRRQSEDHYYEQQPAELWLAGAVRRQAHSGPDAALTAESLTEAHAAPCVWVSLPPGFQPDPQQPRDAAAGGYCVGHLPRSATGISVCLLMSGAASSYYFELPSLQLVLSVNTPERRAEARLQLCHFRPVLRPGVDVWELPP